MAKVLKQKRLGEMLVEHNLLNDKQLSHALVEQKRAGLKLGKYLVHNNIVKENDIVEMLSSQLKIDRYHPDEYPVGPDLKGLIPYETAHKFQVAPLTKSGRLLKVATIDPLDINLMDSLEIEANAEVEPVVCTERELKQLIDAIYGKDIQLESLMEGLEEGDEAEAGHVKKSDTKDVNIGSLKGIAEDAPVIRIVNSILSMAVREEASDVHLSPMPDRGMLRFRIDGKLFEMPPPPKSLFMPVTTRIKLLANMDITVTRIPQDGRFTLNIDNKRVNVRVSALPTVSGENIVMRLLSMDTNIKKLSDLGMNENDAATLSSVIKKPYGLILSTGPTGSGKSTSLYAILNEINKPDINIITLEDPVEYRINTIRQVQLNQKAGMTFASGLRSILRQDPDVIMVGEIRDAETAATAIQAAQTGHLVLSTVHTNDAAGAIARFVDMGIEPFLLASVLLCSFAQRLVRTVCPYCAETYEPPQAIFDEWGVSKIIKADYKIGKGCTQCLNTGYKGRTGIFEVLINDDQVHDMILQRKTAKEITNALKAVNKIKTLKDNAITKISQGRTTFEEAGSSILV